MEFLIQFLTWQSMLLSSAIIGVVFLIFLIIKHLMSGSFLHVLEKCVRGFYLILQSLSGTFSLITLIVIAFVTFIHPAIGGVALAAFATVIPAILSWCEHNEQIQSVAIAAAQASNSPGVETAATIAQNNSAPGQPNLPPNLPTS